LKNISRLLVIFTAFANFSLAYPQSCPLCSSLEVKVSGIRSNKGIVRIALFQDEENFLQTDPKKIEISRVFVRNTKANTAGIVFNFNELQPRNFAFKIFHDENSNETLDQSILGKPLEGLAISGISAKKLESFRPGNYNFQSASFRIPPSKTLKRDVSLYYPK
jgi:uncharacterized protein (DUF2141 family)